MTTAKKATKVAVKKAVKPAGARTSAAVKEATDAAPEPTTITFEGRVMEVRMPEAEQIVAWDSLVKRVQRWDPDTATMADAVKFVGRLYLIIESVLVSDDDKDWLEDERIRGNIDLNKAGAIVSDAIKAFEATMSGAPANRAARRAKK
jgi:hypothetical protein